VSSLIILAASVFEISCGEKKTENPTHAIVVDVVKYTSANLVLIGRNVGCVHVLRIEAVQYTVLLLSA